MKKVKRHETIIEQHMNGVAAALPARTIKHVSEILKHILIGLPGDDQTSDAVYARAIGADLCCDKVINRS